MLWLGTGVVAVVVHLCCTLFFCPGSTLLFWSNEITRKYCRKTTHTKRHVWGLVLMQWEKRAQAYTRRHTHMHIHTDHIGLLCHDGGEKKRNFLAQKGILPGWLIDCCLMEKEKNKSLILPSQTNNPPLRQSAP